MSGSRIEPQNLCQNQTCLVRVMLVFMRKVEHRICFCGNRTSFFTYWMLDPRSKSETKYELEEAPLTKKYRKVEIRTQDPFITTTRLNHRAIIRFETLSLK